jgi:anti-sigma factor RsiW
MTCAESEILLHALLDGELDAGHAPSGGDTFGDLPALCGATACLSRAAAGNAGRAAAFYGADELAPARRDGAAVGAPAHLAPPFWLKGVAMGSALSAAIATLVVTVIRTGHDQRVLGDVVSAHLRSLQGEHLTDVQTSDQHTAKPWFNGKLES